MTEEKSYIDVGAWINKPFTVSEKRDREEFYRLRGVKLEFGERLVEIG